MPIPAHYNLVVASELVSGNGAAMDQTIYENPFRTMAELLRGVRAASSARPASKTEAL